ncbi:MAG: hypothetical protein EOO77_28625 [Oxalobacteraceae bacterium]|nr:MAG: hypothetical protein EOO77_28625 [Oxalobacteraceae bacterium]
MRTILLTRLMASAAALLCVAACGSGGGATSSPVSVVPGVTPTSTPSATPTPTPTPTSTPVATQAVGVSGLHLTLNGQTWLPRSVVIRGFVATPAYLKANLPGTYTGTVNYGAAELAAATAFGADTLRFQVSQPSLDPQSPLYDATYAASVTAAIKQARGAGFVVMISMQDETNSGETGFNPFASASTVRDWDALNATFGTDRGVLYELYNEPRPAKSAANWALWAYGGTNAAGASDPVAIGMQPLLNHLRAAGSQNVMVLDGLGIGRTLDGVPTINDPLGRVVYAVHPYQRGSDDESKWDTDFGIPSTKMPVWADEWSAGFGADIGLGNLTSYQVAVDLLNYLRDHSIPLGGGAFDVPGVMTQSVPGWAPTTYKGSTPANPMGNSGQLVRTLFTTNYSRPLTAADGL